MCLCVHGGGVCAWKSRRGMRSQSCCYRQSEHLTWVQENDIGEMLSFRTSLQSWPFGTSFLFCENLLTYWFSSLSGFLLTLRALCIFRI